MKYTVVWARSAEDRLTEIWLDAEDRESIAAAANAIDEALAEDAHQRGESRTETARVMFVRPLGVDFEVRQGDRIARVLWE